MPAAPLSTRQLGRIHCLYLEGGMNISRTAKQLHIARNTLKRYIGILAALEKTGGTSIRYLFDRLRSVRKPCERALKLFAWFNGLNTAGPGEAYSLWLRYRAAEPAGYSYSQFALHYARWRAARPVCPALNVAVEDLPVLQQWRRSNDRRKWEKAVILLDSAAGKPVRLIALKIERGSAQVTRCLNAYRQQGLSAFERRPRILNSALQNHIRLKKDNLIRLIHENPALHGFNRTSWRLKDLSAVYYQCYGHRLSMATISAYLKTEGYVFRKARQVLTSPDPEFREKLAHIQTTLTQLGPNEKFFSVDEYGPFSVKIKGGRSYTKHGQTKTYPQHQPSKGCLICTAALELSTNQVTHFYSLKKNTDEMIRLIDMLRMKYRNDQKLYFSWDAAVWHASKKLKEHLEIVNAAPFRAAHGTPLIELAPLPSSAQFLNVIESVFSGLARSVIHHSDYPNAGYCKAAIDRYFAERNRYFKVHPKRAGNKIWGQERTVAEFRDDHNCKDPNWR